jgi:hypothetical protein
MQETGFIYFFPKSKKNMLGKGFSKNISGKGKKSTFFGGKKFKKTYQETAKKKQCRKR